VRAQQKDLRTKQRDELLKKKAPETLMSEIHKLNRIESQGPAQGVDPSKVAAKKRKLIEAHKEVLKKQKEDELKAKTQPKEEVTPAFGFRFVLSE
jgi:hypothetical protein